MLLRIVILTIIFVLGGYFLLLSGSTARCLLLPQYEPTGGNTFGLISKRDPCLSKTATDFRLKSICNFAFREDSCLADYAEASRNVDECKKLVGTGNQDYCIRNIAVVHTRNPDICSLISNDLGADSCLKDLSGEVTNTAYCEKFRLKESSAFYADCLANVAKNTKDPSVCEKIQTISIFRVEEVYEECIQNSKN